MENSSFIYFQLFLWHLSHCILSANSMAEVGHSYTTAINCFSRYFLFWGAQKMRVLWGAGRYLLHRSSTLTKYKFPMIWEVGCVKLTSNQYTFMVMMPLTWDSQLRTLLRFYLVLGTQHWAFFLDMLCFSSQLICLSPSMHMAFFWWPINSSNQEGVEERGIRIMSSLMTEEMGQRQKQKRSSIE